MSTKRKLTNKIKPLSGKKLAKELDDIRKMYPDVHISVSVNPSVNPEEAMEKTREILSKSKVSLSGSLMQKKYGGEMWDDLKDWLAVRFAGDYSPLLELMRAKMTEIEKQYGVS